MKFCISYYNDLFKFMSFEKLDIYFYTRKNNKNGCLMHLKQVFIMSKHNGY